MDQTEAALKLLDVILLLCQDPTQASVATLPDLLHHIKKDVSNQSCTRHCELEQLQSFVAELQKDNARYRAQAAEAQNDIARWKSENKASAKILASSEARLREEMANMERQFDDERTRVVSAQAGAVERIRTLESELDVARQNVIELEARCRSEADKSRERVGRADTAERALRTAIERLEAQTQKDASTITSVSASEQLALQELKVVKEELKRMTFENARLELRVRELESSRRQTCDDEDGTHVLEPQTPCPLNGQSIGIGRESMRFGENSAVLVIELGSWRVRCGLVPCNAAEDPPSSFISFPCCVARPKHTQADLQTIVHNAGLQASPMFARFREEGVFVGSDAWYCCYDHPDPALRAALKLECPLLRGHVVKQDDVKRLVQYAVEAMEVDVSTTPVIMTYKPMATAKERQKLAEALFEQCDFGMVRLFNEAFVLSVTAKAPTALIVDIGHDLTRVVPMYEGLVVDIAVKTSPIGGADLSMFMADMLLSCKSEAFSSLVNRKQVEAARMVKEKYGYVAQDFKKEVEKMGKFAREKIDVMGWRRPPPAGAADTGMTVKRGSAEDAEHLVAYVSELQDGKELMLAVGKERFHCPELLFKPELQPPAENDKGDEGHGRQDAGRVVGVVELVLESLRALEPDFWEDLLHNIVLAGGSSLFPGMANRLTKDLKESLPPKFGRVLRVTEAESSVTGREKDQTAVWCGAASLVPTLLSGDRQDDWLSLDVYRQQGPAAADDLKYSGSL